MYSKENEPEDPTAFTDIIAKNEDIARKPHDAQSLGCAICCFPRSEHQKQVQKRRLCKPFLVLAVTPFSIRLRNLDLGGVVKL